MKVIYMSGYTDQTFDNDVLDPGTAFIQKPFVPVALLRKVREVLGQSSDGGEEAPTPAAPP